MIPVLGEYKNERFVRKKKINSESDNKLKTSFSHNITLLRLT